MTHPQKKLIPGILLALMIAAIAAPPLWWGTGNPPVIDPAAAENNHGPANIGQAKHIAKSALDALEAVIPDLATHIEVDLVGTGKPIPNWDAPANQAEKDKNHAPLLIGQLKAIADPFYTHLHAVVPNWLEAERTANGTHHPGSIFPWTTETTDDANKAIANIGQLKAVFSLRFETLATFDSDGDGMPDLWEIENGFDPNDPADANEDPDGDGISNQQEEDLGTDPNSLDPIGPANIGFDEIDDPLSPDLSFRPENPSDLYPESSVPHWNAAIGQHIEIWKEDDGDTYAELQSHWDAKGIEQEFYMLPGTRLTFVLRYKGRYDGYSDSNSFKLKVEGAHELLVNGQPAQIQGSIKQQSFMADDTWEKYAEWHYASVSITADPQATTLVPMTLTLIPEDTDEAITYGGFVDFLAVEIIQPKLSETGGNIIDENGVDEIEVVDTIRFCRWLDSFTGNTLKSDCADNDRDRFRIRIPAVLPNLTKIHIKSSGLLTAVIDGQWVSKSTDGDYDVTMTEENGAMVSKWMLLVSDGDDDVEYNGIGTDNGPNDQTLLADFNSPIEVTLPEYQNAKVTFHAQKPLGDLEIQPYYLSPAGDVPLDTEGFITNHLEKMKEIYRQIGVRVGYFGIEGKAVPQEWFDAVPTPNQAADYFTPSESNLARAAVRGMAVPGKQIRIGFVNATVMQDGTSFNQVQVRGFTDQGSDGIIVSIEQNDARTILGVTAHEVGHALGLNHTSVQSWKRWLMRGDPGETIIWAGKPLEHSKRFQSGDYEVIRNSQSFYVPYVPN